MFIWDFLFHRSIDDVYNIFIEKYSIKNSISLQFFQFYK